MLVIFNLTVTAEATNLELTPATQSVNAGSQATINVVVEDVINLQGANIILNFDAAKLQYTDSDDGSFIPNDTLLVQNIDNINGSVTLDIAGLGAGSYASGTAPIMTVTFNTIAPGDANITFETTLLRDNNNDPIIHTTGSGCSVTVNPI